MVDAARYRGTIQHVYAHWPLYLFLYGAIVAALAAVGGGLSVGLPGIALLALALAVLFSYLLATSLWQAHLLHDRQGLAPHLVLFNLSQAAVTDKLVYIDLGRRREAMDLARRLTTGRLIVFDVYNPQWAPGVALARQRRRAPLPIADPRLQWQESDIRLLPLPDSSARSVFITQVLAEFWQEGDRLQLLRECYRILRPDGRLLLAEPVRSRANWLLSGPLAFRLRSGAYWQHLLLEADFAPVSSKDLRGLVTCWRADKRPTAHSRQLALGLAFGQE